MRRLFRNPTADKIRAFVDRATVLGLRPEDRANAIEMLDNNEWGGAFDIVVIQLFEYGIEIDDDFLRFAREIGDGMKLERRKYDFLEKLVTKN